MDKKPQLVLVYIWNRQGTIFPVKDVEQAVQLADAIVDSDNDCVHFNVTSGDGKSLLLYYPIKEAVQDHCIGKALEQCGDRCHSLAYNSGVPLVERQCVQHGVGTLLGGYTKSDSKTSQSGGVIIYMSKKKNEYRDTFNFCLFQDCTHTKAQKKRLLLFQGRVEHWRAAINYADSFEKPNRINLLYMIGYKPQMKAYVEKTKHNVVVLCAEVPPEFLADYDTYWNLVNRYKGTGYVSQEGVFTPSYFAQIEKEEAYHGTGALSDELYQRNDERAAIISAYERITEEAKEYFSRYRVISKLLPERSISSDDLDWLIQKYFPFGREQCGVGKRAYSSIKKMKRPLCAGLNRADAQKILDLPIGTDNYAVCRQGIRRCQMNLNTALRNDGK